MTILFIDGFENYNAVGDLAGFWLQQDAAPTFLQAGRDASGSSIRLAGGAAQQISHPIVPSISGVTGFAVRYGTLPSTAGQFLEFGNAAANFDLHFSVQITTTGNLEIELGGVTSMQVSTKSLTPGIWYYLEVKWFIDNTTGTVEIFVNGKKGGWIDFTGDTQNVAGTADVDAIRLTGQASFAGDIYDYDDFYVLDLLGSAPGNDRLGDSIVETLNPSGAGAEAQWSPSAGSNFENVDEATPDGDTTFNSSSVVADDDRFAMDNLVNTPSTVFAAQVNGMFRLEDAGARTLKLKVEDTVTEGLGADFAPTFDANYLGEFEVFEDHPTDANPWITAEINGMEAGYRIEA